MKTKNLLGFIAAFSLLTVFSCEREIAPIDDTPVQTTPEVKTYTLTVNAKKGEPGTRALNLDENTHTITATWSQNDPVTVYKGEAELGTLYAQSAGASTTLSGQITADDLQDGDKLTLTFLSPDYENQGGTLEYIAANIDYATAEVTVSLPSEGNTIAISNATFESQQAIVKFTLKNGHTDGALVQAASLVVEAGGRRITVSPSTPDDVLFVAIPAISGADIRLEATTDSYTWGYHKASATFEKGRYYEVGVKMKIVLHVQTEAQLRTYLADRTLSECTFLLDNDIQLAQAATVPVQFAVNIDFCGHYLEGAPSSGVSVLTVNEGVRLTLTGPGGIRNGHAYNGGAIYNAGNLTLNDVTLTGNTATNQGGAIYSTGTITLNGGSVSDNTAQNTAGIFLSGGSLTMTGGTVGGNTANGNCGGVSVSNGSTFTMSGGSIENNSANNRGAMHVGSSSTFTMTGGSITGNTATSSIGGINVEGTLSMSGNPVVSGNTADNSTSNLCLALGTVITVAGAFTEGADVHVTLNEKRGIVTSGYPSYNGSIDPATYFFPDGSFCFYLKDGEAALAPVSYKNYLGRWNDNSGLVLTVTEKSAGATYSISGLAGQNDYPVEAVFENGRLVVYEQFVSSDGGVQVALQGSDGSTPSYPGSNIGILFSAATDEIEEKLSIYGANDYGNYTFNRYVNQRYDSSSGSGGIPSSMVRFVLFYEDFERGDDALVDWIRIDKDGDGSNWYPEGDGSIAHSGTKTLASPSLDRWNHKAYKPNNWAFTPPIQLTADKTYYLSFWVTAQDDEDIKEHYAVYVIDKTPTSGNLDDCTKLLEQTYPSGTPAETASNTRQSDGYQRYVLQIPSKFNGKTVYIGFRHFDCTKQYWINIDDVAVFEGNSQ